MDRSEDPVQLGLFGEGAPVLGLHVVQAHLRLLPAGGTTFVCEHVRWNRGRRSTAEARSTSPARPAAPEADDPRQLGWWGR